MDSVVPKGDVFKKHVQYVLPGRGKSLYIFLFTEMSDTC